MDYFNISSELAKAKEPAFKSGMLKRYAKGGFTGRSEYKRSIENDIRVGMYEEGGLEGGLSSSNPSSLNPITITSRRRNAPLYVSSLDDPRLQAYNDSMSVYNFQQNALSTLNSSRNLREWENYAFNPQNSLNYNPAFQRLTALNQVQPRPTSYVGRTFNGVPGNGVFLYDKPKNKVVFADPKIVAKQKQLKETGLYSGELDGIWGPKSEEAWKKYEEASKPKPAPVVNKPTTTPAPRAEIVKDEKYHLPRNQAPVLPSGKMNPQVYRGSGNTAGIETDASGNPIMANGGLKKYAKGALTTDPPKTGLSAYNPLFMPPKPKITNSPVPISSEEKMRQAISGEVNRRTATTESTRTQPKLVSQEQKQYAKENNEESLRQKRLADAAAAEKEEMTLGNWPELLARRSQATADKLDIPFIPNVIDPAYMLGSMASGLGAVPYNIQQGNYGQAAWSVAAPVLTGALAGLGAKSTGQFVNNIANPIPINNLGNYLTTQTPLRNAYKYNPWAFKVNEANWYRQVGKSAIDDALSTGVIREAGEEVSPRMWEEFQNQIKRLRGEGIEDSFEKMKQSVLAGRRPASPFFAKGELFYPMGRKPTITKFGKVSNNPAGKGSADYLIETALPNESFQPAYVKNMSLGVPEDIGSTAILKPNPDLRSLENFKLYEQNWLRGYKEIPKNSSVKIKSIPNQYEKGGLKSYAKGGLIKRADGSYSRRGLWDNIRANRGSGKKPTKQMLEQEKKIKAKTKYEKGGKNPIVLANNDYDLTQAPKEGNYLMPDVNRPYYVDAQGNERSEYRMGVNLDGKETLIPTVVNGKQLTQEQAVQRYYQTGLHMGQFNSPEEAEYASQLRTKKYNVLKDAVRSSPELEKFSKGGYRVTRTSERKGKTHKVTGPDGSVKYFGDPSMGERSKSKYGKDAFYKRHAKSLKKNPHFRAYAKATWSDGGLVSESDLFNLSSY